MSKKASKSVIGIFVVSAIALATISVIIFGGGEFLRERHNFVMYFEADVKGLNIGAPVMFQGVEIGMVTDIALLSDPETLIYKIPVVIEIYPDKIKTTVKRGRINPAERIAELINKGLRAQLQMKSLVTGQLMVKLDMLPEKPAKLIGTDPPYPEIPTIPSSFDEIAGTLRELPIKELLSKATSAFASIDRLASSPKVEGSIDSLDQMLKAIQKLVANVDSRVEPLATAAEETLRDGRKLINNVDNEVKPLASNVDSTVTAAGAAFTQAKETLSFRKGALAETAKSFKGAADSIKAAADDSRPTMGEVKKAVANIESMTRKGSLERERFDKMLKELSDAARSIKNWASYLERHPEALIRGKGDRRQRR